MKHIAKAFYKHNKHLILFFSFSSFSFAGDKSITLPKEINLTIKKYTDLRSNDNLRGTCHYWKNLIDANPTHPGLMNLLHSLPTATEQILAQVLIYAVYNNDEKLTKLIVKKSPKNNLYFKLTDSNYIFDPYDIAQTNKNKIILDLLKKYNYHQKIYGLDDNKNVIIEWAWPQSTLLQKLLIACITGDDTSLNQILNIPFDAQDVMDSMHATIAIQDAGSILIQNNDKACFSYFMNFIKNNNQYDSVIQLLIYKIYCMENTTLFESLIQHLPDINALKKDVINGIKIKRTFKDCIFDTLFIPGKSPEYVKTITSILNQYGAKTAQELAEESQSQSLQ